ncbi:MAG: hypothetical protein ACYC0H_03320, partial [Solirubrobacteraceae bacterium]
DETVRQLIDTAHQDVTALLTAHRDQLQTLAQALLKHETLDEPDAYAAAGMPHRPTDSPQLTAAGIATGRGDLPPPSANGRPLNAN